ncbi:MAG: U32 family peptidase [Candidatus Binataceae bacterium]|jgi:collagenase-like PrtC family protease
MKLAAPISAPDDAAVLAGAGADEFYCGVVPREWESRFGRSTLNRRMGGNLGSFDELARAVRTSHDLGKQISVAVNAQNYSSDRWDDLLALLSRIADSGADAVIVGDFGLLAALSERRLPLRIHLSSIASCHNSETAALTAELGAERVILPRHVTLAEIERIGRQVPGLELEAFVLNDGCVFEEGSCHTLHLPPALGGPICLDRFEYRYRRDDGNPLSAAERERFDANDREYEKWLWYTFSCGFTVTAEGFPHGPCGLCAIARLKQAGIAAVKVAGREGPLERRLRSVEMVRSVMDRAAKEPEEEVVATFARGLRENRELCSSGYMCYYREVAP